MDTVAELYVIVKQLLLIYKPQISKHFHDVRTALGCCTFCSRFSLL